MIIEVTSGSGIGRTCLSAFDNALFMAGIANYNLLMLSSVIPSKSRVTVCQANRNDLEYGNKLYIVLSRKDEETIGCVACAGLGWIQRKDGSGLFVEHIGDSEEQVIDLIKFSLEDMASYREDGYGEINYRVNSVKCAGKPVCSVVAAVYQSEGWNTTGGKK